ncbi:MAG: CHASE3 domain-containing protein [Aliihoeflea sp.]
MPTANTNFIRATAALLLIGLAALTIIVSMSIWLVELNEDEFDRVLAVRVVRSNAVDLRAALQDIETSQRGFLLTTSESYLGPYNQSRDDIAPLYASLVQHAPTLPQVTEPVERLGEIIDAKLLELDGTIQLVRAGQQQAAI